MSEGSDFYEYVNIMLVVNYLVMKQRHDHNMFATEQQ